MSPSVIAIATSVVFGALKKADVSKFSDQGADKRLPQPARGDVDFGPGKLAESALRKDWLER